MSRVYLDYNASAPLRPEARAAISNAMDAFGNPSSVHGEGRAAKAVIERARAQIAEALGADGADIVFTSSATEAAALACAARPLLGSEIEHDAVRVAITPALAPDARGVVQVAEPSNSALQLANSETGVVQEIPRGLALCDVTQAFGKRVFGFDQSAVDMAIASAHKIGGPKGIGLLALRRGVDIAAQIRGGGQEMGRRSGTENILGIAGFGAAAAAAARDLANGVWERVEKLRNILEEAIEAGTKRTIFVGQDAQRLPNTSCFLTPGWKGETQVMAMDLAGFAISAGSACSSGKVKPSRVLRAIGYSAQEAASAVRVSLGPATTEDEVLRFADAWLKAERKFQAKAA